MGPIWTTNAVRSQEELLDSSFRGFCTNQGFSQATNKIAKSLMKDWMGFTSSIVMQKESKLLKGYKARVF